MNRTNWVSWALGLAVAVGITLPPYVYYRMSYEYQKRLRVVTAGKLYRSGCMTSSGLEAAIKTHSIRTVINLMEESPDPVLRRHYWGWASDKESDIVARTGARYLQMTVKYLPRNKAPFERPQTIERYLEILDDPASYPVLVHCKAGLHRTGVLIALYRMEYEGWSREQALAEMRANGFGEFASTAANEYVQQYVLGYRPHVRPAAAEVRMPAGKLVSRPGAQQPGTLAPLPKD